MTAQATDQKSSEQAPLSYWVILVLTYLLMPLILFACAGDTSWWQGWVLSLLLLVIGIGSRILAEKRHPGLMAERGKFGKDQNVKPWDKILAPLMAISISIPMLMTAGLDHRYGWSPALPLWLQIAGFIFIALGYCFATWAIVENRYFSSLVRIQMDRGHEVCSSGPYRIVRHPGYAGNMLALPGIVLALGSVWTALPAIAAWIIAIIRTVLEDQTLQQELPGYREYAGHVPYRLIPGIF